MQKTNLLYTTLVSSAILPFDIFLTRHAKEIVRPAHHLDGVAHAFFYSETPMNQIDNALFNASLVYARTQPQLELTLDGVNLTKKVAHIHGDLLIDAKKVDLDYVLTARHPRATNYEVAKILRPVISKLADLGMVSGTYHDKIAYCKNGHFAFLDR